ncbi:MAG TPA: hypothetical protein VLA77_01210 [Candidatus Saccharimonadales bacterium]|nr:hypothetical protein [Candidatus Saccharimonadales bacterium]
MDNKRKLHHYLVVLGGIKVWQLALIFVLLLGLSAYLLRQNNLQMVEYRNLVKMADESGQGIEQSLLDLQKYVTNHMNTNLGEGLFLEHSYQRAYDAALKEAASSVNPNSATYIQAEDECRAQYGNVSFQLYLQCIQQRVSSLAPGTDPLQSVKVPPAELFRYNYVSPRISFDLAGIVVLITLFVGLLILLRVTTYAVLKIIVRRHK